MMQDTIRQAPIRWPAPAKLNLFLHVNGRRPDGYHELQTLFIFLDHGDWLEFEPLPGTSLLTLSPAIPGVPDEQNLIIRAARLLQGGCQARWGPISGWRRYCPWEAASAAARLTPPPPWWR